MIIRLHRVFLGLVASAVMGSGVGYSKIYLFHLVLIGFILIWSYYSISNKQRTLSFPRNRFISFLFVMFFWYLIGIAWSIEPLYTVNYLFYFAVGISLVLLLCAYANNRRKYLQVFKVLCVFFLLALVVALLESFTSFRLPTSPYSEYASLFGRKQTDFNEFESSVQALIRSAPTAFWGNPNNLSIAMVMLLPFFLMRSGFAIKLMGTFCILLIIAMTGSRGAFIAFLFGLLIYVFISGLRYWLPVLIVSLTFSILLADNLEKLKGSEFKRVSELALTGEALFTYVFERSESNDSIGARKQLMQNGLDALWKTGGLGVGGGGSVAIQERLGGVAGKLTSMHNFWVEMLVEAGVLFFTFFMILYLAIAIKLLRIYKLSREKFYTYHAGAVFITMLLFLVAAVSASSVIYFLPMWLMLGLAIALISIYKRERSLLNRNLMLSNY